MLTTLNSDTPLFECYRCTEQALFDYGIILSQLGRHDVGPRQIHTVIFTSFVAWSMSADLLVCCFVIRMLLGVSRRLWC